MWASVVAAARGLVAPLHWDLSGPGIELVSPALAGGFLTTGSQSPSSVS